MEPTDRDPSVPTAARDAPWWSVALWSAVVYAGLGISVGDLLVPSMLSLRWPPGVEPAFRIIVPALTCAGLLAGARRRPPWWPWLPLAFGSLCLGAFDLADPSWPMVIDVARAIQLGVGSIDWFSPAFWAVDQMTGPPSPADVMGFVQFLALAHAPCAVAAAMALRLSPRRRPWEGLLAVEAVYFSSGVWPGCRGSARRWSWAS